MRIPKSTDRVGHASANAKALLRTGQVGPKGHSAYHGWVRTELGFVIVATMPRAFIKLPNKRSYFGPVTRLRFTLLGREYMRSLPKMLSERGITTASKRFAMTVWDSVMKDLDE